MINFKKILTEYINNNDAIKAKDTIKGEKKLMRSLLRCFDYIGLVNLEQLTFESYNDIVRYYRENTNNKNASINKFTTFLKTAIRYFGYHTHPFLLTKKLRSDVVHVRPYNQDDLLDIFKYMDRLEKSENSSVYRLVFHMLYATGCRITELLDIKIRNTDLKQRTILLEKTKARTSRYVFFTQHQTDLIKTEMNKNHQQTWLFWNHIKNRRLSKEDIKNFNRKLKVKLGLISLNSRQFRKTMATDLAKVTGNLKMIQTILGHADIKMTQVYVDYSTDQAKESYDNAVNQLAGYNQSK